MTNLHFWLKANNLKPIKFYPYTSCVINRIIEQSHNYEIPEHDFIEELCNEVKSKVIDQISWDNKVVIECEFTHNIQDRAVKMSNIFIGKYDGRWSIGFGVYSDSWIEPIEIK